MKRAELTQQVKEKAHQLGFTLVGVASAEPLQSFGRYQEWLDAGYHAEMDYLAHETQLQKRADSKQILPECQSILVLALPYSNPAQAPRMIEDVPKGRIAAYAWGDDYHDVLKPRLQEIVAFIETEIGHSIPNRWYTDTGPILERELAQRAGLGWIGKNSMLINPQAGSYFFLAEILLGIELEADPSFEADHCGTCTRCIDACPTDCILPNRTLDAGRCLSYLTIELKGSVPVHQRTDIKDWVFGCDICQEVCPWNIRFAPDSGDPAFAPHPDLAAPKLKEELSLTAEHFNEKFRASPLKRAKRRGYLRNVALALGNAADPAAIPSLAQALASDPEPLLRAHAAWALGRFEEESAKAALKSALIAEKDLDVCAEIELALSE